MPRGVGLQRGEAGNAVILNNVRKPSVAVVIPSFRAGATVGAVLRGIGPEVARIYVVDDGCPEGSGEKARRESADPRLIVLHTRRNRGVGGAMKLGYRQALADGADIVVKLDADGQMDAAHIGRLIAPIVAGTAHYAKGNRFAPPASMPPGSPAALGGMPRRRQLANRALAAVHGVATGYWHVADPANGYTAIEAKMLATIGIDGIADCFFFETDMLHRLNLAGARVTEVPLPAFYPGSGTTLSLRRVAPRFAALIVRRTLERLRGARAAPATAGAAAVRI